MCASLAGDASFPYPPLGARGLPLSITLDICAGNPAHVRFHGVHKAQSSLLSPIKKGGKRRQEVGPLAFGKPTLVNQSPFHFKDLLHHDYDHNTGAFQWLLGLPRSSPRNKQSRVGPGFCAATDDETPAAASSSTPRGDQQPNANQGRQTVCM